MSRVNKANESTSPAAARNVRDVARCTRRQLWRSLLQEAVVGYKSVQGGESGRLATLADLSDEQLAAIRPVANREYAVFLKEGAVWYRYLKTGAESELFRAEQANLAVYNHFDGLHTLGQIGKALALDMGWDEARAFGHARDLFLMLASRLVCVPRDPPPER